MKLKTKVNWMEETINLVIIRYNNIATYLGLPNIDLQTEMKKQDLPFQLNFVFKKKIQDEVSSKSKLFKLKFIKNTLLSG